MSKDANSKIIKKLKEGIAYIERQDEKLQPVLEYLTESILTGMEELSADKKFEYLIQFMAMKNEGLLLLTKMKEILEYKKKDKN